MSAGLTDVLAGHPELFALLADGKVPHNTVVDRVNEALAPSYSTTESSVRRARQKLAETLIEPEDGAATTRSTFTDADRAELHRRLDVILDKSNVDPSKVQGLRVSQWDGFSKGDDGEPTVTTLYGVNLNTRFSNLAWTERVPSLEELALIRDYIPAGIRAHTEPEGTLVVALGDLQVGKVNIDSRTVGTDALIARVRATTAAVVRHIQISGRNPSRIVLLHAGDCIEGYTSQGGRLIKMQDMFLTQQVETYQRILEFQILELAPLCDRLDVAVVPGNHDETTRDYEVPSDDSWALFAARGALRILESARPELAAKVVWHFPAENNLAVEFNVADPSDPFYLTMVHGHKIAGSANQIMQWWRNMTFGNRPGASSRILITGHFHHYRSETAGDGKTWIQVPAMDGGSAWFSARRGDDTPPGMVTFWLEPDRAYPIQNLMVHSEAR